MDLRPALTELAEKHHLGAGDVARLHALAGLDDEPNNLGRTIPMGIGILGAALLGLGIIFWIAANWDTLSRVARFALLQGVLLATCAGAIWLPRARLALGVLSCLAIGALFAFFGQTYQTGADPWQLFALWAALALPLCLGVKHDALWLVWTLVAMTAISLWTRAHVTPGWNRETSDTAMHLAAWTAAILVTASFTPPFRAYNGAGEWAMRTAVTLTALMVGFAAIAGLFFHAGAQPHYWLAVLAFGAAAATFATPSLHDTFSLSVLGLGLNVVLVAGVVRLLFSGANNHWFMPLLITGCVAAALLAGTVKLVLALSRKHDGGADA